MYKIKNFKAMGNYGRWWKPIKGFDGYYVCENGRVASIKRTKHLAFAYELSYAIIRKGEKSRKVVYLYKDKKRYKMLVSRLVAQAFLPNPDNKPIVHHKDCNSMNNDVNNLLWVTESEHNKIHQDIRRAKKYRKNRIA